MNKVEGRTDTVKAPGSGGNMTQQLLSETGGQNKPQHPPQYHLSFPYFNMDCSFASSFFCRSITPRMILLSSSVKWLRSGRSGMAPAAAAGPGPPRGPCGADILHTGCSYRGGERTCLLNPSAWVGSNQI